MGLQAEFEARVLLGWEPVQRALRVVKDAEQLQYDNIYFLLVRGAFMPPTPIVLLMHRLVH